MKEINFLPEWYESGRRHRISMRTQYIALCGVFLIMVVWNFVAGYSVSSAKAGLEQTKSKIAVAEGASRRFAGLKEQIAEFEKKAGSIEEIDSKIDVSGVLAELSFLIDEKIVLSKVQLNSEQFGDEQAAGTNRSSRSGVRMAGGSLSGRESLMVGQVRFKVTINGVASDASDVAKLIRKLEDSPYFFHVYPSFSRDRQLTSTGVDSTGRGVSEFEIVSYLANYREE